MVEGAGFEPTKSVAWQIYSLLRLTTPPSLHRGDIQYNADFFVSNNPAWLASPLAKAYPPFTQGDSKC